MLKNYSLALQERSVLLGLASGFSLQASNLFSTGQYEKVLETYFKCLETVRRARDKEREAGTLYNIGEVFARLNQYV